jgi:CheY-like chemotaxis protein
MEDRAFILVAEDQPDDAFLFEHTFAGLGIVDYYIARDGLEIIQYLEGKAHFSNRSLYPYPSCLLLDLKMPRVSGFDLLEWMQRHHEHRLVPTVVISASPHPADVRRAYELGANSYFSKCTKLQDMIRILSLIEEYWSVAKCPHVDACGQCLT